MKLHHTRFWFLLIILCTFSITSDASKSTASEEESKKEIEEWRREQQQKNDRDPAICTLVVPKYPEGSGDTITDTYTAIGVYEDFLQNQQIEINWDAAGVLEGVATHIQTIGLRVQAFLDPASGFMPNPHWEKPPADQLKAIESLRKPYRKLVALWLSKLNLVHIEKRGNVRWGRGLDDETHFGTRPADYTSDAEDHEPQRDDQRQSATEMSRADSANSSAIQGAERSTRARNNWLKYLKIVGFCGVAVQGIRYCWHTIAQRTFSSTGKKLKPQEEDVALQQRNGLKK